MAVILASAVVVDGEQALAFRVARQGLDERRPLTLAEAAACPASDFQRGSALLALAARSDGVTRDVYDRATDSGQLVVAPSLRAAIHAIAPSDFGLYGRALVAEDDEDLIAQLGPAARWQSGDGSWRPAQALAMVAEATRQALAGERALTKDELHAALRELVPAELLPWCKGCGSHHVAPMVWRFGGVVAGARCDSKRRYTLGAPVQAPAAAHAARRFLHFYGPAIEKDFAGWAGLARAHAHRIWIQLAGELVEVEVDGRRRWLLAGDEAALASPPQARGVRLLPPRDPHLQHPDRSSLAPDPSVRKRLFRPVAGPGAVLQDGRLSGLWRARGRGRRVEVSIEVLGAVDRDGLEAEAARLAALRGAESATITWS